MTKHSKLFLIIFFTSLFWLIESPLLSKENIGVRLTAQWHHEGEVFGRVFHSLIDQDGDLVGHFYKSPVRVISASKIVTFGNYGEGPNDLIGSMSSFLFNDDLAIVERGNKIKIFAKKDGNYSWKATKWLESSKYLSLVKNGVFVDNKLFLAGYHFWELKQKKRDSMVFDVCYLKVYDEKGKSIKNLIKETFQNQNLYMYMLFHVVADEKGRVFFLSEDRLNVRVVSIESLSVTDVIELDKPSFYKKMPAHFYVDRKHPDKKNSLRNLTIDLENWATGYSAISKVVMYENYLVLQIRTCDQNKKKFALLFYDSTKGFKLEKTVFMDDFLLGAVDGKLYCFKNGNPGRDNNTSNCIINVFQLEK